LLSGEEISPAAIANAKALLKGAWVRHNLLSTKSQSFS
jgi:hypothetical protein